MLSMKKLKYFILPLISLMLGGACHTANGGNIDEIRLILSKNPEIALELFGKERFTDEELTKCIDSIAVAGGEHYFPNGLHRGCDGKSGDGKTCYGEVATFERMLNYSIMFKNFKDRTGRPPLNAEINK